MGKAVMDVLSLSGWRGVEDGWVLLGKMEGETLVIADLIDAGPKAERGTKHVSFDAEHLASQSLVKRRRNPSLFVIGTAHTHPPASPNPSDGDAIALKPWVKNLRLGFGVFGIVSDNVLLWFALETGGRFEPLSVRYDQPS